VFATLGRLGLAGVIAAAVTTVVLVVMTLLFGDEKAASAIQLAVGAVVLFATYVAAALWLRVPEVKELATMVGSRLRR